MVSYQLTMSQTAVKYRMVQKLRDWALFIKNMQNILDSKTMIHFMCDLKAC